METEAAILGHTSLDWSNRGLANIGRQAPRGTTHVPPYVLTSNLMRRLALITLGDRAQARSNLDRPLVSANVTELAPTVCVVATLADRQ
jgi:hypothetical protein